MSSASAGLTCPKPYSDCGIKRPSFCLPTLALPYQTKASRAKRTIEIRRGGSAVYKKIGTGDEGSAVAHQQFGNISHLVCRAGTACRAFGKHILVEVAARTVKLVNGKRRDYNARRNGVDARTAPAQRTDSYMTRFTLQRFAS